MGYEYAPEVIKDSAAKVKEVMDRNKKLTLTTKEACEILGSTPESLLNSAEQNNLPFGYMHNKGNRYRRGLVISKLALWNWLMKGNVWNG